MTSFIEKYKVSPGASEEKIVEQSPTEKISVLEKYKSSSQKEGKKPFSYQEFEEKTLSNLKDYDKSVKEQIVDPLARHTANIFATIAGIPGDIGSLLPDLGPFSGAAKKLPGSSEIKEKLSNISGGYLDYKKPEEKIAGDIISDITSMALVPGSKGYTLARNIGIPLAGAFIKEGSKKLGIGESKSEMAKLGTMVALDLATRNSGGVKKYINELYEKSNSLLPKGLSISAETLSPSLNKLEKSLVSGGSRPSTVDALKKIEEIQSKVKNGKIDAKELQDFRISINELIDKHGGFSLETPIKVRKKIIRNLNEVKGLTIQALEEYGKKYNPEYYKMSRAANEAYAANAQSHMITNFLKDKVGFTPKSKALSALFSLGPIVGGAAAAVTKPSALAYAAPVYAGYKGLQVLNQVIKSPTLRKYYENVIKYSVAGNAPQAAKSLKKLDKELEE